MHLWDRLIPQSVLTLNLLRPSRRNPNISAYQALNGTYNYDATPLAPPGCKTIAFESPQTRRTFAPHGVHAWYIGPSLEHYRCYKIYVPKTRAERVCDTVSFHSHLCQAPVLQPLDVAVIAANDLTKALHEYENKHDRKDNATDDTIKALQTLSKIFQTRLKNRHNRNTPPRVVTTIKVTPSPSPRVDMSTLPTSSRVHLISPDKTPRISPTSRPHKYNTRLSVAKHGAYAIVDEHTGKSLEFRHLIKMPKYKNI